MLKVELNLNHVIGFFSIQRDHLPNVVSVSVREKSPLTEAATNFASQAHFTETGTLLRMAFF